MSARAAFDEAQAWATRYAEYLHASATRATRTTELNRTVVRLVAEGTLSPADVDAHHAGHLLRHGEAYRDAVAAEVTDFLTGLVASGTTYAAELVEAVAPGAAGSREPAAPPAFDADDWSTWFERLTAYATAENAAVAAMLREVMERVARGEIAPQAVQDVTTAFAGDAMPETVEEVVRGFYDLLSGLDRTYSDFVAGYLTSVVELAATTPRQQATGGLDLAGAPEEVVSGQVAVRNDGATDVPVRVVVTDVRRADGIGPAFPAEVGLTPERCTVPAGGEELVTVRVRLTAPLEPGPEHVGTLHVLGPRRTLLQVPLTLRVRVPAPPEDADGGEPGEP
jgi:hypothetical protein